MSRIAPAAVPARGTQLARNKVTTRSLILPDSRLISNSLARVQRLHIRYARRAEYKSTCRTPQCVPAVPNSASPLITRVKKNEYALASNAP